jgi:hypothetical protein
MGKTVDNWEVGGTLAVIGATTLNGNFAAGTGASDYLATYNWLALDGDGVKAHGLKLWDFGTDAYRFTYLRNNFVEGDGATGLASTDVVRPAFPGAKIGYTIEGGAAILLTNKTGSNSVKGSLVEASENNNNAFELEAADGIDPIGVVYSNGVPDGGLCWVVIGGIAEGLLEDQTAATQGNWVGLSATAAGRVDMTAGSPANQTRHFQECGHCLETVSAGGPGELVLAKFLMHFN